MDINYAKFLLDEVHKDYNTMAGQFSRVRGEIWEEMRFLFNDYLKPKEKILDVGCGNGRFYELLKDKGIEYFGVDISEKLIEIAKSKYNGVDFRVGDALKLPFADDFFDKVYAIALLHHIPSKEFRLKVLRETKRVLKNKGLLILTVWNLWQKRKTRELIFKYGASKILGKSPKQSFQDATGQAKLDFKDILMKWEGVEDCYFHCFSKRELVKLVKEADFSIIKSGEILVGVKSKRFKKLPTSNFFVIAQKP
jgi:ubiquinone/menaquinone biosynthesis C-methylase UbiE